MNYALHFQQLYPLQLASDLADGLAFTFTVDLKKSLDWPGYCSYMLSWFMHSAEYVQLLFIYLINE